MVLKKILKILKKDLHFWDSSAIIPHASGGAAEYGGIAQLGERLNGIQEVSGSIPLISTKQERKALKTAVFRAFS